MVHTVRVCHLSALRWQYEVFTIADTNALEGNFGFLRRDDFSGPQDRRVLQRPLVYTRGLTQCGQSASTSLCHYVARSFLFFSYSNRLKKKENAALRDNKSAAQQLPSFAKIHPASVFRGYCCVSSPPKNSPVTSATCAALRKNVS